MNETKILILGSNGFLGNNIKNLIEIKENYNFIFSDRNNVDILNKEKLENYFNDIKPNLVINCSGIVGSSLINSSINDFNIFNDNIIMNMNILNCCLKYNVQKLITFSSYRIFGENPIDLYNEDNIEDNNINTNLGYLYSKRFLHIQMKLIKEINYKLIINSYIIPNIFGYNDNFINNGRIIPSFIYKICKAKKENTDIYINSNAENKVNLIFVNDIINILENNIYNITPNFDDNIIIFNKNGIYSIGEILNLIKEITCFEGKIFFKENTLNKNINKNESIMNPDISKFEKYFPDFKFSDIKESLKETINNYIFTTGIL